MGEGRDLPQTGEGPGFSPENLFAGGFSHLARSKRSSALGASSAHAPPQLLETEARQP